MDDPTTTDLVAPSRRVPYSEIFSFLGENLGGSTLKLQARAVRDTTGTPLIERTTGAGLSIPYAGTDTVANHVIAGRLLAEGDDNIYEMVNPATGNLYQPTDSLLLSQVYVSLDTGNLAAVPLPVGGAGSGPSRCWYDIVRTPASGDPVILMRGEVVVEPAVTIP